MNTAEEILGQVNHFVEIGFEKPMITFSPMKFDPIGGDCTASGSSTMVKQILFVQGGGEGGYEWDARLAASLQSELGPGYKIHFPKMPNEASPEYAAWEKQISGSLATLDSDVILAGHSLGGAILIKVLTEKKATYKSSGVFLISAPFCGEGGWAWEEAALRKDAGKRLSFPLFLYHSRDDEEVPYAHLDLYLEAFPRALVRRLSGRNHQLNDDLSEVAADIKGLD